MGKKRHIVVIIMLAAAATVSFLLPKPKYESPEVISRLNLPMRFSGWHGRDISSKLDPNDPRYNFISEVMARIYANKYGESVLCIILDAANFHNPKACFGGSGFQARDVGNVQLFDKGGLNGHMVFFSKGNDSGNSVLVIYWMCVNKEPVDWGRQKFLELWYSVFHRQKIGVMVRLDVPTREERIDNALKLAREFLSSARAAMPEEMSGYVFGEGVGS